MPLTPGPQVLDLGNPVSGHPDNLGRALWLLGLPEIPGVGGGSLMLPDLTGKLAAGPRYTTGASFVGGPRWVASPDGTLGPSFNGTSQYANTPTDTPWAQTGPFTLAARVKPATTADGEILCWIVSGSEGWDLGVAAGKFRGSARGINVDLCSSLTSVVAGVWYDVVYTWSPSGQAIYVNGVLDNTAASANTAIALVSSSKFLTLGGRNDVPGSSLWSGAISSARVMTRAVDAGWVARNYRGTLAPRTDPRLRRYTPKAWVFGGAAAGGGSTFPESLAGNTTPSGRLTLLVSKALAGSSTPSGVLAKQDQKPLAGSVAPAGSLAKQDQKPLAGSSAPTGTLTTVTVKLLSVAGSVTPAGAVTKQADKALAGSTTPAGTVTKQAAKPLAGSTTLTGAVTKQTQKPLAGSTTPSGALSTVRAALLSVAGAITAAGNLVRAVLKALAGSVTGTGTLTTSGGSVAAPTPTHPPLYWSADRPPLYWRNPEDA